MVGAIRRVLTKKKHREFEQGYRVEQQDRRPLERTNIGGIVTKKTGCELLGCCLP